MRTSTPRSLSAADLRHIALRGSCLSDRLQLAGEQPASVGRLEDAEALLSQWSDRVFRGRRDLLQRRVAWLGTSPAAAARSLARDQWPHGRPLPAWTRTLRLVSSVAARAARSQCRTPNRRSGERPLPFEELFAPFLSVARRRLQRRLRAGGSLFSSDAIRTLERQLLNSLLAVAEQTLSLEFCLYRQRHMSRFAQIVARAENSKADGLYRAFVQQHLGEGFRRLLLEYPVMARLLATNVIRWVAATAELADRIRSDLDLIREHFSPATPPGRVAQLRPGMSDPHNGRRSVCIVRFESGLRVVYKPRNLGLEQAFSGLLSWFNAHCESARLRIPRILDRRKYGWMELVEHRKCDSAGELHRFYSRVGMLMAILYTLQASDCHCENIIAAGDQPVIVDLETLCAPELKHHLSSEVPHAQRLASRTVFRNSVWRSGLLPRWDVSPDGRTFDVTGIGYEPGQRLPVPSADWKQVNCDWMSLAYEHRSSDEANNLPFASGSAGGLVNRYGGDVVAGFETAYRVLLRHRDLLAREDGPLRSFRGRRARFLFRPTRSYCHLLRQSLSPRWLRDGFQRSIVLDLLSRWFLADPRREVLAPLLEGELAALEAMDVPLLTTRTTSNRLGGNGREPALGCFESTGISGVRARLMRLGEVDLRRQREHIALALGIHQPATIRAGRQAETVRPVSDEPNAKSRGAAFLDMALSIAEEIKRRAIRGNNGSLAWLACEERVSHRRIQMKAVDESFYDGLSGIAWFLAAAAKAADSAELRDTALRAMDWVRNRLRRDSAVDDWGDSIGMGAAAGMGGIIYASARIGRSLQVDRLLDLASRLAAMIDRDRISADARFDVMHGSAGAILGLLGLYEATHDGEVLGRAVECGQHLVSCQVRCASGGSAWATGPQSRPLTGFSHGAAGIAYALARLAATCGNQRFVDAAREAIEYENSAFDTSAGNWPDLRSDEPGPAACQKSWCHGAPGIGLARAASLEVLDNDLIRRDIECGVAAASAPNVSDVDHLCCGNLGRADILLEIGRRLGCRRLVSAARRNVARLASRRGRESGYRLFHQPAGSAYSPSLFRGMAGVGYGLLRQSDPDAFPCLLLWK